MFLVKLGDTFYRFESFISVLFHDTLVTLRFPDNKAATITLEQWNSVTKDNLTVIESLDHKSA